MRVEIHPDAESRLIEVWEYTESEWGEAQADKYIQKLVAAIRGLPDCRYRWRKLPDEKLAGIYFIRHAHHYIFFRQLSSQKLGVIQVLHENMALPSQLE
jgi:toxin ParE1/3/4